MLVDGPGNSGSTIKSPTPEKNIKIISEKISMNINFSILGIPLKEIRLLTVSW